jgi:flavin reductase (DIM6/NTAB) family NADH-FMN oxidoreductase RutF
VAWRSGLLGLPVLEGVLTAIECRLHSVLPGGDHSIFIGEVINVEIGEGAPLLYYRRGYHELR